METRCICIIVQLVLIPFIISDKNDLETSNCPSSVKTITEVLYMIKPSKELKIWTDESMIGVKRNDIFIFKYIPKTIYAPLQNPRVEYKTAKLNVTLILNFDDDIDSAESFEICYKKNKDTECDIICSFTVEDSDITHLALSREEKNNVLVHLRGIYLEGEYIQIKCVMVCFTKNRTFKIQFPEGADYYPVTENPKLLVYELKLTKNIKSKSISCIANDGTNVSRNDYLYFNNIKEKKVVQNKTKIGISLAIVFTLMLCLALPIGTYTLIIKQRSIVTDEILVHHAQETQYRIQTEMTNITRMSKVSRADIG